MMKCCRTTALGLAAGLLILSGSGFDAARAQAVIAPTNPELAALLDIQSGTKFVLKHGNHVQQIARQDTPQRFRICVTAGTTPGSRNVAARVTADGTSTTLDVGRCGVVEGRSVTVAAAETLGAGRRVTGRYAPME